MGLHGSFNKLSDVLSFSDWSYPVTLEPNGFISFPMWEGEAHAWRCLECMITLAVTEHTGTCVPVCVLYTSITWGLVVSSNYSRKGHLLARSDTHKFRQSASQSPRADLPKSWRLRYETRTMKARSQSSE